MSSCSFLLLPVAVGLEISLLLSGNKIYIFSQHTYIIFTLGALNWRFPVDLFPGGVGLYIFSEISGKIVLKQ